ncbi:MAG: hypothetical protein EBR82_25435 [Caulobacteraceae bacterium]|nr:hypothetical protein [Caulobacteraceae bacterium]
MFEALLDEMRKDLAPYASRIVDAETVQTELALRRQVRIAEANARIQHRFMEGLGEVVAQIDVDIYHRLAHIYGYETVNSPDFMRCLLRDNPELRVKSTADRLTLRVDGRRDAATETEPATLTAEDCADLCTEGAPLEPGDRQYFTP